MSKTTLTLLLALLIATPALAAKSVTVEQLSHEIASLNKKKDSSAADRLYGMQLTERLSANKLAAFEAELPGPDSRRALVAIADQSQFLDPPPADIPSRSAPIIADQRAIIAKSINYAEAVLHRLPNLYARRDTIRYEDFPAGLRDENTDTIIPYEPLHPVSRSVNTVLYRDGREILQKNAAQESGPNPKKNGMITFGEFGALFPVLYGDLPKGNLRWGYWEQGQAGLEAVFRFNVPKPDSHYTVQFCCVDGKVFQQFSAYHGELTLDPSNGTILRVTLIADLAGNAPLTQAELMVDYGPVELGGKKYYCPAKSISVSRAPAQASVKTPALPGFRPGLVGMNARAGEHSSAAMQTMLNETVFDDYHLFRADVQILTANNSEDESTPSEPANASSGPAASSTAAPAGEPGVTNDFPAPAAPAAGEVANNEAPEESRPAVTATPQLNTSPKNPPSAPSPAAADTATPPEPSQPPASAAPSPQTSTQELAAIVPAHVPQTPVPPPMPFGKSGFSLSINSRLVDVDVTAIDGKGRPVTGLTRNDFAIFDNGRKQTLASFSHVSGTASPIEQTSAKTAQPALYTNRPLNAPRTSASAPGSSTILLLDPTSLDFADLNYAREQILKFLNRLPNSEPVGLYVRTGFGFRILSEETTDHAALVSKLSRWLPTAKDLATAQEAEMRNRKQFDTVDSTDAMGGLNGQIIMPGSGLPVADPKRMQEGGVDPARASFGVLIEVAAHLKAIPGHKNLVWVASDNVLENWSEQTPDTNVSKSRIGGSGLRAQEALNDAHVSIYPLDASQLEAGGTSASLENASAELSASQETMDPHANDEGRMKGGRTQAAMLQDMHAIQHAVQQAAQATGGRAFRRSGNLIGELNSVIDDGDAAYMLSFAPDTPPDGKYHQIRVAVPGRRGIKLRYRTGYLYSKEPTTMKQRIQQAIWQPRDETSIGINARRGQASQGTAISLSIAAGDLDLKRQSDRWTDKLDIFLVQLDGTGTHAAVKDQSLSLNLTPAAYQNLLRNGIPFADYVEHLQATGTVRIIVVDENSDRMGSVTLPVMSVRAAR